MNQYQNMANFMPNGKSMYSPYFNGTNPSGVSTQNAINNIIQVQGIEGAKAYQLNPNSMVVLLDSEDDGKMYIKTSDNIGRVTLRIFDYEEEVTQVPSAKNNVTVNQDLDLSAFVRKDELNSLIKEIITNEQVVSATPEAGTGNSDPAPAKPKVTFIGASNKQS